jgi:hypothetical protein
VRHDDYDVDGKDGVKAAPSEYDTNEDATSRLASLVFSLVKSDRGSRKLYKVLSTIASQTRRRQLR